LPSLDDLRHYYRSVYRVEIGKGKIPSKRRLWRICRAGLERALDLLPRLAEGARTLDIGCGAGELVYLLRAAGCDANGFDPDARYIDWARGIMGGAVEENTIEGFAPSRDFDATFLYHVLEHMPDPRHVFHRCGEWLKEGGLLVVEVPNVEARNQAPGHQYIKPHLHYFNKTTLTVLGGQHGFTVEEGGTYNSDENLRCYFRKDVRAERPESRQPGNAERVQALLAGHDRLSHYTSTIPYARLWARVSRTVAEALRTLGRTHEAILAEAADELRAQGNLLR
jgi:2-polyprenyl-3-methyl-5-hydroxy-6-metoxy-1,4-benzoquinol methylase